MRAVVRMIKSTIGCQTQNCGCHDWRTLDFHHIDPSQKKFELSQIHILCGSWKSMFLELAKCRVLCRNCHAKLQYRVKPR